MRNNILYPPNLYIFIIGKFYQLHYKEDNFIFIFLLRTKAKTVSQRVTAVKLSPDSHFASAVFVQTLYSSYLYTFLLLNANSPRRFLRRNSFLDSLYSSFKYVVFVINFKKLSVYGIGSGFNSNSFAIKANINFFTLYITTAVMQIF